MIYEDYIIKGPYKRPDGRMYIQVISPKKTTISYPKYLMEMKLGRYLEKDETVHHKDEDFTNNDYSNLEILRRDKHASIHKKYISESFICPTCGNIFILEGIKLRKFYNNKRNKNINGPFCNRICAGKYGKKIQMGEYPN